MQYEDEQYQNQTEYYDNHPLQPQDDNQYYYEPVEGPQFSNQLQNPEPTNVEMTNPVIKRGFPFWDRVGTSCMGVAQCFGKSDESLYTKGYTHDVMLQEADKIWDNLGPIIQQYRDMALYLKIYDTNGLELDPHVIHPIVKIHVMDLRTHRYLEKRELNGALNFEENVGQLSANKQYGTGFCPIIPPFSTTPCDMRIKGECDPHWDQDFLINEDASHILNPNVIFLFEILDYNFKLLKQNSNLLRDDNMYPIAWAFFRPVGSSKLHLGVTKLQLYRFKFKKPKGFYEYQRPEVYYNFCWFKKNLYPSFLRVELRAIERPYPEVIRFQSVTSPFQKEEGRKTFEEMEAEADQPRFYKLAGKEELDEESLARMKRLTSWKRHHFEGCRIPNKLAFKLKACELGCFRLAFSNNGRFLAAGCTYKETVIKIYQVEDGELAHSLYGHSDLVHDLVWSEDDQFLISSSSDGTTKVWDLSNLMQVGYEGYGMISINPGTAEELLVSLNHPSYVYCARIHPDYRFSGAIFIATACFDGRVRLWLVMKEIQQTVEGLDQIVGSYQFIDEIEIIDIKEDEEYAYEIQQNMQQEDAVKKRQYPNYLTFDLQGFLYISDSLGVIHIWNIEVRDGTLVPSFIRQIILNELQGDVINTTLLQPPEMRQIIVSSRDNAIRRLHPAQANVQYSQDLVDTRFFGARLNKYACRSCVSPDGLYVLSGSEDGKSYLWDIPRGLMEDNSSWECYVNDLVTDVAWNNEYNMIAIASFGSELPILVYVYEKSQEQVEAGLQAYKLQEAEERLVPHKEYKSDFVNKIENF